VPRPAVHLRLCNQSSLTAETINRAKVVVVRIYRGDAGIDVVWAECSPDQASSAFAILVMVRTTAAGVSRDAHALGTTIGRHESGGTAFVFKDRVLQVAHKRNHDVSQVLAYAIAHEIGHMLLPPPAHSDQGIMRADWTGDDLRRIGLDALNFTPVQAAQMRSMLTTTRSGT
jgi:hypothetical protein